MKTIEDLALQSFCLRGFESNKEVAAKTKECGLSCIELCGKHVDFSDETSFDEVIGIYRDAGVRIVSIGVQRFSDNEAAERKFFEFARKAGVKTMSVDFVLDTVPGCYRTAEALAEEYDVNLGIHNHGGQHWLGSSAVLANVFKQTGPMIGLMLDTAWALHSHEDPIQLAERFSDRLFGVHIKDFTFDSAGEHEDVVVGTGNLDLPALVKIMTGESFGGPAILEYEGDVDNPIPALKSCVEKISAEITES